MTNDTDQTVTAPTRKPIDVRECCERWARWRYSGAALIYWHPRVASGGQFLVGRGSKACPTCKGSGRMPGYLVGSALDFINHPCPTCDGSKQVMGDLKTDKKAKPVTCSECNKGELKDGRTCIKCRGSGWRVIENLTVHPVTIKGTRRFGQNQDPQPISALIDRAVAAWMNSNSRFWLARVIFAEYCGENENQEIKAMAMRVSQPWYSKNLNEAHRLLGDLIANAEKKHHY